MGVGVGARSDWMRGSDVEVYCVRWTVGAHRLKR